MRYPPRRPQFEGACRAFASQSSETHAELPLSELDRQATPASQDSLFSNDAEKVFEMLRTRIGLGA